VPPLSLIIDQLQFLAAVTLRVPDMDSEHLIDVVTVLKRNGKELHPAWGYTELLNVGGVVREDVLEDMVFLGVSDHLNLLQRLDLLPVVL
jgi:hypothetical protein